VYFNSERKNVLNIIKRIS